MFSTSLDNAAHFFECVQHLNSDATLPVLLKSYNFGTVSRILKIQRAKQVRIKFPVDLDAKTWRNRAQNHVFSDFWCFIEFSCPGGVVSQWFYLVELVVSLTIWYWQCVQSTDNQILACLALWIFKIGLTVPKLEHL